MKQDRCGGRDARVACYVKARMIKERRQALEIAQKCEHVAVISSLSYGRYRLVPNRGTFWENVPLLRTFSCSHFH